MIIVADENLHRCIVERLRQDEHIVDQIGDLAPSVTDAEVLAISVQQCALLITNDLDFGELVFVKGRVMPAS